MSTAKTTPPVMSDHYEDNYHQFFVDAIDMGCVWGLQTQEGDWALCGSEKHETTDVMPFWSQPEFASCHTTGDWEGYEVVAIALSEFMDDWLTGMHSDVILVGINWNQALEGGEYEPLDVLHTFESEYLA